MRFQDVLNDRSGKKYKRPIWVYGVFIYFHVQGNFWATNTNESFIAIHEDMVADDWEVFEEPKKGPSMKIVVSTSPLGLQEPAELCTLEQLAAALAPYIKKELQGD